MPILKTYKVQTFYTHVYLRLIVYFMWPFQKKTSVAANERQRVIYRSTRYVSSQEVKTTVSTVGFLRTQISISPSVLQP